MQPSLGGGSLYDVGCYPVHYIGLIMNMLPVAYKAEAVFDQGVDTQFCGIVRYDTDVIATINCGFNAFMEQHSRIIGTQGIIDVPDTFAGKKGVVTVVNDSGRKQIEITECDRYREVVTNFSNAVLGKPSNTVPLQDSLRNMRVIDGLLGTLYV
jgi:predicted dehydrogenase